MTDEKKESLGLHRNTLFSTSESSTASSKDRLKDFDATKQKQWLEFSKNVIQDLGTRISSFPQVPPVVHQDIHCPAEMLHSRVGCTYAWLADKRREVAKMLKQGPLRHQFGLINKAGFVSTDAFNLSQDLPGQKNLIYEHLIDLMHQNKEHIEVIQQQHKLGDGTKYTITIKLTGEERELLHQKNEASQIPFVEDDIILTITFDDYGKEDSRTSIVVDHRPTPFNQNYRDRSSYFHVQFELIEPYFQACCDWNPDHDIKDFLVNAGKLAHRLAQLQPVGRGNSAIVEWMIRGLAKEKNIELGPFNQNELGWDFKAFLTPDSNVYAHWFADRAFTRPALAESEYLTPKTL
ncbi:LidE [Legionella steigerwaltii]|uniref:LidE n=2 Tax=Legionella steigerwaltii TaxID=460 RepID=A0A378LCD1_9GAMM|nr:LidE [Legionella steigerwaltii]STY21761.1 LidE [Legionella steigerwaltii]